MGYVIAGLIVLLIIVAGVTVMVLSSRRHGRELPRAAADEDYGGGAPGSETAIFARDPDVPLGDTAEHAGEQREGETVAPEGGAEPPPGSPHAAPPVDGGEGEGRRRV